MKKSVKLISMLVLVSFLALTLSGCFGSFSLTKKVYKFNKGVGAEPMQTLVMWVFNFVPVYGAAVWLDMVVFNTLEYWTGSNPIAMKANEKEIKKYAVNGTELQVVTTQNRYDFEDMKTHEKMSFVYNPATNEWLKESDGKVVIITKQMGDSIRLISADGKNVKEVANN